MGSVYLDNNATTEPAPEVVEIMHRALTEWWANPSSVHRAGQMVRQQMELARELTARLIGCEGRELTFTSGGTEAADLAICGSIDAWRHAHPNRTPILVTSRLEHSAVRELAERLSQRGVEVIWLDNDDRGLIELEHLDTVLTERGGDTALVSIMWANNETGVLQPIEAIGEICRRHAVRFHTDATQWVGKHPVNAHALPADLLSFAAHKFHGPKGAGCLYARKGVRLDAQVIGGPQERERRGGTEHVGGILGLGKAAELALKWLSSDGTNHQEALRDRFEHAVLNACDGAHVNPRDRAAVNRLWNTSNIAFPGLDAEAVLLMLSERGVYASAGAACSSGSLDPSPVLEAMDLPPVSAQGSIRFSLSRNTTAEEIDRAVETIAAVVEKLRAVPTT